MLSPSFSWRVKSTSLLPLPPAPRRYDSWLVCYVSRLFLSTHTAISAAVGAGAAAPVSHSGFASPCNHSKPPNFSTLPYTPSPCASSAAKPVRTCMQKKEGEPQKASDDIGVASGGEPGHGHDSGNISFTDAAAYRRAFGVKGGNSRPSRGGKTPGGGGGDGAALDDIGMVGGRGRGGIRSSGVGSSASAAAVAAAVVAAASLASTGLQGGSGGGAGSRESAGCRGVENDCAGNNAANSAVAEDSSGGGANGGRDGGVPGSGADACATTNGVATTVANTLKSPVEGLASKESVPEGDGAAGAVEASAAALSLVAAAAAVAATMLAPVASPSRAASTTTAAPSASPDGVASPAGNGTRTYIDRNGKRQAVVERNLSRTESAAAAGAAAAPAPVPVPVPAPRTSRPDVVRLTGETSAAATGGSVSGGGGGASSSASGAAPPRRNFRANLNIAIAHGAALDAADAPRMGAAAAAPVLTHTEPSSPVGIRNAARRAPSRAISASNAALEGGGAGNTATAAISSTPPDAGSQTPAKPLASPSGTRRPSLHDAVALRMSRGSGTNRPSAVDVVGVKPAGRSAALSRLNSAASIGGGSGGVASPSSPTSAGGGGGALTHEPVRSPASPSGSLGASGRGPRRRRDRGSPSSPVEAEGFGGGGAAAG
ncbi:unnamed protein product [Phaeothamnion confervicola]